MNVNLYTYIHTPQQLFRRVKIKNYLKTIFFFKAIDKKYEIIALLYNKGF
jgi:hypothetical protein